MPKYIPSIPFEDCYGSVGDITFFHRDGQCYYKSRQSPSFPGTAAQLEQKDVHLRAIAAWQGLSSDAQKEWNRCAVGVQSHRPPFDGKSGISGYNLFVSAYHGFVRLGNEHVPEPAPWEEFPAFAVSGVSALSVEAGALRLGFQVYLEEGAEAGRYRVLVRLQLVKPGGGRDIGEMRTFLAEGFLSAGDNTVVVEVEDYVSRWGLDLQAYTVHVRVNLLDARTGYRNIYRQMKFPFQL